MASIQSNTNNTYYAILNVVETSYSIGGNYSDIYYELYLYNGAQKFSGYTIGYRVNINGEEVAYHDNNGNQTSMSANSSKLVISGSKTIYHNTDGTKNGMPISFEIWTNNLSYLPVYLSASGSMNLTHIPRYVNITSFSVSKRDETSVLYNWSADANCDYAWYSTDGGSSWSALPNSNIVSELSPNTTYNFKLRLRRTDSQLTTDSASYSQTTYDYPKPTSINDFVIGEGANVTLYNPLSRKCKLEIISREDDSVLGTYEGTYAGNVNVEFKTESAIDAQYKSIPNSQSGKYYAKVTYGDSVKTKGDGTYSVKADECYPEFQNFEYEDISVNALNLTENNQLLINNYSECQFKIAVANKAIAKKYASIAYYYCTWGNKSVNINEDSEKEVIGSILGGTGGTLKVVAVDSRGLRSQVDTTINVPFIPYTAPIISNLETQRKDGVDIETYIAFKINMFNGNWDNESKENTLVAVKYRAKFGDEEYGEWGDITDTVLALTPYINGDVKTYTLSLYNKTLIHANGSSGGFETGKAYTVQLMVQDGCDTYYLETIYSTTDVIDGKIGMSRYKDSNGDYHYGINRMPDPNCNFVTDKASFGAPYDPEEGGSLQVDGKNILKLATETVKWRGYYKGSCNDILETGICYVSGGTDCPEELNGVNYGFLTTKHINDNYMVQIFEDVNSNRSWKRTKSGGTWGSWQRQALIKDAVWLTTPLTINIATSLQDININKSKLIIIYYTFDGNNYCNSLVIAKTQPDWSIVNDFQGVVGYVLVDWNNGYLQISTYSHANFKVLGYSLIM